uniref:Uncharacterized protein n=1 Tax=Picocystis salinarum TaxID=88271 RepID=A0A6U9R5J7_9CHLO|mmetsp:Transcript_972/g.3744  ORF Transcript_972/g.3744 Transcript_972/m.3744 type:complete len:369 (-) Transcript_972:220-1326(-)
MHRETKLRPPTPTEEESIDRTSTSKREVRTGKGRRNLESSDDVAVDGRREGDVPKWSVDADVLPRIRSKEKKKKIDPRETGAIAAAFGGIASSSLLEEHDMPKEKKKGKERSSRCGHAKIRSKLVSHRVQAMKDTYQVDVEDKPGTSKEVPVLLDSPSPSHPSAEEPPSCHEEGCATEPNDLPLHGKAAQYLAMVGRELDKRDPLRPKKSFLGQRLIALIQHGDRRTSSYMHFQRSLYDRMVQGKASLPSKSLKVDEAGSYLIHQPASNKRRQPARMVPCANDWMDLIERADLELQHPNDPNGLHSYLLAKGFAKPPLLACQLWVQHCIPCEEENEEGCKAVDDLELMTKKELVDMLRQRNDESPVSN